MRRRITRGRTKTLPKKDKNQTKNGMLSNITFVCQISSHVIATVIECHVHCPMVYCQIVSLIKTQTDKNKKTKSHKSVIVTVTIIEGVKRAEKQGNYRATTERRNS